MSKRIPLVEAKAAELRTFARSHLGMQPPVTLSTEQLRAQIGAAWDKDYIEVPDADATAAPTAPPTQDRDAPASGKIRVVIARTEEAGGSEPVPVGVNGVVMLVPRGKPVDVPEAYFEVLKNAIATHYDQVNHPDGSMEMVPREVPAFPFHVLA